MKIFSYIVYGILYVSSMFVLNSAGVGCNQWQFWLIAFGYTIANTCGWIIGWKDGRNDGHR